MELALGRPRADHRRRDARRRRPRRLLRHVRRAARHGAEPPPAAALPGRDGAADLRRPRDRARREAQGAPGAAADDAETTSTATPCAASTARALVDGGAVPSYTEDLGTAGQRAPRRSSPSRAEVQNWRWAGVPFYLRTGKRMDRRLSEIVVVFKDPPHAMFPHSEGAREPNRLMIQLQPDEGMQLHMTAKEPGPGGIRLQPVSLDLSYADGLQACASPDAYERLLMDVIRGNPTLFMRRDEVEAAWAWVEPILRGWADQRPSRPKRYPAGTSGPDRRDHAARARRPHLAGVRSNDARTTPLHPVVADVTERIIERSAASRAAYLDAHPRGGRRAARRAARWPAPTSRTASPRREAGRQGGAARAHQAQPGDRHLLQRHAVGAPAVRATTPRSAEARPCAAGGIAQVAGGVPAMCDGITQGRDGMQLSLFSRDVIAMATAIALSHDMFDGALHARRVRQDRAGAADRRAGVRPPADGLRPGRADAVRSAQQREGAGAPAVRRGQGRPRGAARGRGGVLPLGRARARSTARPTPTSC